MAENIKNVNIRYVIAMAFQLYSKLFMEEHSLLTSTMK